MLQFLANCTRAVPSSPALPPHSNPVNFNEYCQQKAAPPGSSTYYALRQAPAASQPRLTALFALRREFEETVKETSDPTIGRTKLAWWQNEIAALASGSPSHPVSKALAAYLPNVKAQYPALQARALAGAARYDPASSWSPLIARLALAQAR